MSKWPKKVKHRNKVLAEIYPLPAPAGPATATPR